VVGITNLVRFSDQESGVVIQEIAHNVA
jgi:hypothetical protein